MAQNRRTDDMSIQILSEKFDKFATESAIWRKETGDAVKLNTAQIKCLADHFIKYKPQLEEGLIRRKWWEKFWEERRQELITYAVKGGAATLFGLVVFALWTKFTAALQRIFSGMQ